MSVRECFELNWKQNKTSETESISVEKKQNRQKAKKQEEIKKTNRLNSENVWRNKKL